jgi:uncharacterized protein (DUF2252 family)
MVVPDLKEKHRRMAGDGFAFFRATFYRWAEIWPILCADLNVAPVVLGVGDIHVENFGTWRDAEGRLIWGINDFDEAHPVPYTQDLIRLATSVHFPRTKGGLSIKPKEACGIILSGYRKGLERGGQPVVLAEHHKWLGALALKRIDEHAAYWEKLTRLPSYRGSIPQRLAVALKDALPAHSVPVKTVHRQAGLGSLGRQRFCQLARWSGGLVAREAKALAASAWTRLQARPTSCVIYYKAIVETAIRVPDPTVRLSNGWLIRRLAPDCSRISLASLPNRYNEERMLGMMGFELANIHLGTKQAGNAILKDLRLRDKNWAWKASTRMAKATNDDWLAWRKSREADSHGRK